MYGKSWIILAYLRKGKAFAAFYNEEWEKIIQNAVFPLTSILTSTYDFVNIQFFLIAKVTHCYLINLLKSH